MTAKCCFNCQSVRVCEVQTAIYGAFDKYWGLMDGKKTLNSEIHILIAKHCQHYVRGRK